MRVKHLLLAATLLAGTHLGHAARAAEEVAICTGGKSGVYYGAGQTIAAADKSQVTIKPVETKGSWENLGLVAEGKTCKAAIVQSDAIPAFARARAADARVLTRASTLHREYVHALCNRRAGIDNLYYVDAKHPVAVGESGSGSWVTFQNWINYDKDRYGVVPPAFEGGIIGAGLAAEAGSRSSGRAERRHRYAGARETSFRFSPRSRHDTASHLGCRDVRPLRPEPAAAASIVVSFSAAM